MDALVSIELTALSRREVNGKFEPDSSFPHNQPKPGPTASIASIAPVSGSGHHADLRWRAEHVCSARVFQTSTCSAMAGLEIAAADSLIIDLSPKLLQI